MKKYKYVKVNYTTVWSTDPSIVDWIYDEIKKIISTCAIRNEDFNLKGERIGFQLHQLQDKDSQVADWIIKLLCENGFEPFTFTYYGGGQSVLSIGHFHFRKLIEE